MGLNDREPWPNTAPKRRAFAWLVPRRQADHATLDAGHVRLKAKVFTTFHRELVRPEWIGELSRFLATHPAVGGRAARGVLFSKFNEERFMGPQSVVKYRFVVNLLRDEPGVPLQSRIRFTVEYRPAIQGFVLKYYIQKYLWDEELLSHLLLQEGLLTADALGQAVETVRAMSSARKILGRGSLARWLLDSGLLSEETLREFVGVGVATEEQVASAGLLHDIEWSRACGALLVTDGLIVIDSVLALEAFDWVQSFSRGAQPLLAPPAAFAKRIEELTQTRGDSVVG